MKTKTYLLANRLALATSLLLFFITSSLVAQIPSYVPTNGLVGYWPFNGNANDESGNGNNGTVNGATLTMGRNGNASSAYSFDGVNDFIDIQNTNGLSSTLGISLSVWIKWNGPNGIDSHQYIYLIAPNPNAGMTILNNGTFGNNVVNCNCSSDLGIETSIQTNTWYFAVLTYNLSEGLLKMYLNGNLISSTQENIFQYYTTNNPADRFGNYHFNSLFYYGFIDDAGLWNRALTQEEITSLYNGTTNTPIAGCTNNTACNYNASATQDDGSCTYPDQTYLNCAGTCINDADNDGTCDELETPALPSYLPSNGLVGYWPFNGNANDESGNGNHGTVNGATLTSDRNGNANSAYSFDGVDDFIGLGGINIFGNQSRTISMWFKSNSVSCLLSIGSASDANAFNVVTYSNYLGVMGYGPDFYPTTGGDNVLNDSWHLVIVTLNNNGELKIFVDGQLENQTSINFNTQGIDNFIGKSNHFDWPAFHNGQLDDIAIYNRALTPTEITALYNGTTNNGGGGNGGTAGTPAPSVPQGIPYQAMIRDNNGAALINNPVTVRFSLRQDAIDGTVEYQETHNLTTNAFGLINAHFGTGTATQGTFANINWSNTTKFIQVEANTGGGFVEMGTQQMMSVPFALQSNKATMIKNAGLPVYANNAAALAGGLVAGDMYRTATGDLKIVY